MRLPRPSMARLRSIRRRFAVDEKTLLGSYSSSFPILDEVTGIVLGEYRKGFDLTQLISHRFQMEEAVEAIEIASHPQAAR